MNCGIPLFNPSKELKLCGSAVDEVWQRVTASGIFVNGYECERFEAACAAWCGVPFAVGVSSGTMALELMLRAEGVGSGDRVVITAHTFAAVVEAILAVGAQPQFVDIDPQTWQMPSGNWPDRYVIVSHLYGGVSPAVNSNGVRLFEDASQSFGGLLGNKRLGTFGRAGAVSLYPTKNLSAVGDAGVILTHDAELARVLRALRNHGQTEPSCHDYCGTTGRLDEIHAGILCEKLNHFEDFLRVRRRAASFYIEGLRDLPLPMPKDVSDATAAPNLFVVRTSARTELRQYLKLCGIATGIHYPTPLHKLPAFRDQPWSEVVLPETERLCNEILSLPLWVGITEDEQVRVIEALLKYFRNATKRQVFPAN